MPITTEILKEYRKHGNIFIETGTHNGGGVRKALEAGFDEVHSIEITDKWYAYNVELYADENRAFIYHGNSATVLPFLLMAIDETCVFWLDAHPSGNDTGGGEVENPLSQELVAISDHPIDDHVILIDDMPDNGPSHKAYNDMLYKKLKAINPDYNVRHIDGHDGTRIWPKYIIAATL